jgi:hypothetical protein
MVKRILYPVFIAASACAFAQAPATKPAEASKAAEPAKAPEAPKLPEAFIKAKEAADKGDFATAAKLLTAEAEKGNVEAMTAVAEFYGAGRGVTASPETAVKWLSKAADAGSHQAQTTLAGLLFQGAPGLPKDTERARFLLQQAAEAGYSPAQYQAGVLAESAVDTKSREPNWKECRDWYEKAAAAGNPDGLLAMVRFYDMGLGGAPDPEKGTESCLAAARAGSVVAMNEMGVRYQRGTGIRKDNVAAIGWFTVATQNGLPSAFINLGNCYETGNGVRIDYARAGENYAAAAKAGNPVAQAMIARMFEEGKGTAKNNTYAFVNYARAAAGGIADAAKKRDEIKALLKPEEMKDAEKILSTPNGQNAGGKTDPKKDAPKKK